MQKFVHFSAIANIVKTWNTVDVAETGRDGRRTISRVIVRDAVDDKNEKRRVEKTEINRRESPPRKGERLKRKNGERQARGRRRDATTDRHRRTSVTNCAYTA